MAAAVVFGTGQHGRRPDELTAHVAAPTGGTWVVAVGEITCVVGRAYVARREETRMFYVAAVEGHYPCSSGSGGKGGEGKTHTTATGGIHTAPSRALPQPHSCPL